MAVVINNQVLEQNKDIIIADALLGGDTLKNEDITIVPNVINDENLQVMDVDAPMGAYTCDFTDTGTINFNGKKISVEDLGVMLSFCIERLEKTWLAALMKGKYLNKPVPKVFQDFLVERIKAKVAAQNDTLIWQGDKASNNAYINKYNGLLKAFVADNTVIDETINAVTVANVYDEIMKAYVKIPKEIMFKYDTLQMYVSYNVAHAWLAAQGKNNVIKDWMVGDRDLNFLQYRMKPIGGLPVDTIVIAEKTNLFFGTDLITDFNDMRIVDHRLTTNEDKVTVRMSMRAGVLHGKGNEIVYARPA